jgi:hypothetical protein
VAAKKNMTKAEAVRRAVAELGRDAERTELQGHIKTKYGIEMSLNHISVEKRKALKKPAAAKRPAQVSAARTAEPKPAANRHAVSLNDIAATKSLVERVGADSLKELIDVLAR